MERDARCFGSKGALSLSPILPCCACVQTTLQVGPDESSPHYCCVHWPVARCSQEVEERRMSLVPPFFWCEEHPLTLSLTPHIPHPSSLTLTPHITPASLTPLSSLIPNSLHPSPLTFLIPLLHPSHPSLPSPLTTLTPHSLLSRSYSLSWLD